MHPSRETRDFRGIALPPRCARGGTPARRSGLEAIVAQVEPARNSPVSRRSAAKYPRPGCVRRSRTSAACRFRRTLARRRLAVSDVAHHLGSDPARPAGRRRREPAQPQACVSVGCAGHGDVMSERSLRFSQRQRRRRGPGAARGDRAANHGAAAPTVTTIHARHDRPRVRARRAAPSRLRPAPAPTRRACGPRQSLRRDLLPRDRAHQRLRVRRARVLHRCQARRTGRRGLQAARGGPRRRRSHWRAAAIPTRVQPFALNLTQPTDFGTLYSARRNPRAVRRGPSARPARASRRRALCQCRSRRWAARRPR